MQAEAVFLAKADGVLAGVALAERVFAAVDPALRVEWVAGDGAKVARGLKFGTVRGAGRGQEQAPPLCLIRSAKPTCFGVCTRGKS